MSEAQKNLTGLERQQIAEEYIYKNTFINQDALVRDCLNNELFTWDDVENLYITDDEEEQQPQDIFSWIWVEPQTANKLKKRGQPVLFNDYGTWWGRTCFGQLYSMDTVIEDIALEIYNG